MTGPFQNLGTKLLALAGALLLWGVAHGESPIDVGFDVPVVPSGVPPRLVVVDQSSDAVNVRIQGTRAALRRLSVGELQYTVDLSGAKPGKTRHDVDTARLKLPRGTKIVSRSPASLEFTLERKATKAVKVRPDLDGQPAPGFKLGTPEVDPPRVRITGARSEVLRLSEVLTETIDVGGADAPIVRKVKPSLLGRHVWLEGDGDIQVRIPVLPVEDEAKEKPARGRKK